MPLRVSVPAGRGRGLVRVALAASIAVMAGAVGAVAALRGRAADTPPLASPESPHPAPAVRDERLPAPAGEPPTVAIHACRDGQARPPRARGWRRGPLHGRARSSSAGARGVHAPRFFGRSHAGRRARSTVPQGTSRGAARGVARAVPGGLRAKRRSAPCRRCLRGPLSAQRSSAARRGGRESSRNDRRRRPRGPAVDEVTPRIRRRARLRRRRLARVAWTGRDPGARGKLHGGPSVCRRAGLS